MTSPVAVVANEAISVEELVSFLSSLAVRIAVAKVVDRGTVEIDREDVVAHNLQAVHHAIALQRMRKRIEAVFLTGLRKAHYPGFCAECASCC